LTAKTEIFPVDELLIWKVDILLAVRIFSIAAGVKSKFKYTVSIRDMLHVPEGCCSSGFNEKEYR
jgi:hypothetical protein